MPLHDNKSLALQSSNIVTNNDNKQILNQALKLSKDELKQLDKIYHNVTLAQRRKRYLDNINYRNHINDLEYKDYIISLHNETIYYANHFKGIQFWRTNNSTNSNIYHRINPYGKKMKLNKDGELYSLLGRNIKIFNTINEVQLFDNTLILIIDYLSIVEDEIFYPIDYLEWQEINYKDYKNTFKYSKYLEKRILVQEKQRLETILNNQNQSQLNFTFSPVSYIPNQPNQPFQLTPFSSIQNKPYIIVGDNNYILNTIKQSLQQTNSFILDFIKYLSKKEARFNYITNWLAHFFQTMNMSAGAIILIGDSDTTDIFINNIIKPIFAYKKEYFSTINDDILKKDDKVILKNKIFHHIDIDNLSEDKIKRVNKLLRTMIKPNNIDIVTALEEDEIFIYGETIVTSSNESPYPFIKDAYSRCSVFNVTHIDMILKRLNIDLLQLEEMIQDDLHNFSNILAQYQLNNQYFNIADTEEKYNLFTMKNGIIRTSELEKNIDEFISQIQNKNIDYFSKIEIDDKESFEELKYNFNEDMIAQPLLSTYFNFIYGDIIFSENNHLLDILKEKDSMFQKTPDDKNKYNGKKRYKILAKPSSGFGVK